MAPWAQPVWRKLSEAAERLASGAQRSADQPLGKTAIDERNGSLESLHRCVFHLFKEFSPIWRKMTSR